jgi:uncharacterized membrane protein required for colicin V production
MQKMKNAKFLYFKIIIAIAFCIYIALIVIDFGSHFYMRIIGSIFGLITGYIAIYHSYNQKSE